MSHTMSEIKTNFELPRGDDDTKYTQRVAQDLSKNFKAIRKEIDQISQSTINYVSGINGVKLSATFSISVPVFGYGSSTYTLTHNIGSIPSGFIVSDIISSTSATTSDPVITKVSWTATQIVVRIGSLNSSLAGGATLSGTFTIIVLR